MNNRFRISYLFQMNNVLHKKTLDFIARTFYNPNQEHISNAMMEKSNVQILRELTVGASR